MAIRYSSSSSFQLLATLVLFALLISPMFASPLVEENQSHNHAAAGNGKQPLAVEENHSGEAKQSDQASPSLETFEEDKRRRHHHHHHHYGSYGGYGGYGGLGGGGYGSGGYGGLGGGGGYGSRGCMGASSCVCHCMNGRVATAKEVLQAASKSTKP